MYYDDRFHPVDSNDFDDYDSRRNHTLQNLKSLDKNYHKYNKMVTVEDETGYRSQKKVLISILKSPSVIQILFFMILQNNMNDINTGSYPQKSRKNG